MFLRLLKIKKKQLKEMLTPQDWNDFNDAMAQAKESFFQKEITWLRVVERIDRWGEDNLGTTPQSITLKCLINYNYMRTWPISMGTESGELDRQSAQILFMKSDLEAGGYLTGAGYFNYDPVMDRFIIDGIIHKPVGDTPVSQANSNDVMFSIVVKREEPNTPNVR